MAALSEVLRPERHQTRVRINPAGNELAVVGTPNGRVVGLTVKEDTKGDVRGYVAVPVRFPVRVGDRLLPALPDLNPQEYRLLSFNPTEIVEITGVGEVSFHSGSKHLLNLQLTAPPYIQLTQGSLFELPHAIPNIGARSELEDTLQQEK